MSFLENPAKLAELIGDLPVTSNDATGIQNTIKQLDRLIEYISDEGKTNEDDAKKVIVASIVAEGEKKGGDGREVYNSYPQEAKAKLTYTPDDLARNQEITVLGTKVAIGVFIGSFIAALVAAVGSIALAKYIPGWLKIPAAVAIPAIIAAFLQRIGWTISTAINNLNDVFHWGPLLLSQQQKATGTKVPGISTTPTEKTPTTYPPRTRITMSVQAKPKIYVGTLFSARISSDKVFERLLDDQITSADDLKNDAQQNLNRWLASLPSRLVYQISVQNSPFDENGIKQLGMWATLSLLLRRVSGQMVPVDTILLGPVDPLIYYPKPTETKQIQVELPKLLTAEEVAKVELPTGEIKFIDQTGAQVPISLAEGIKVGSAAAAPAAPALPIPAETYQLKPGETTEQYNARIAAERTKASASAGAPAPATTPQAASTPQPAPAVQTPAPAAAPTVGTFAKRSDGATIYKSPGTGQEWVFFANYTGALRDQAMADMRTEQSRGRFSQADVDAVLAYYTAPAPTYPRNVTVNIDAVMVRASPNSSAALAGSQRLARGVTFAVTGWTTGESVNGENRWWISQYGNFVWVGGTAEKP